MNRLPSYATCIKSCVYITPFNRSGNHHTISHNSFNSPIQNNVLQQIEIKYNRNLKVSVNLQADYWDKVTTMFAAGTPPDILWMGDGQVATYASLGYLADIDELMNRISASLELVPITVQLASVDGQLMFMPFDWGAWSLAYNTRLFDESGLTYPADTWTWTDFARAAQQTTRFSGEHATVQGTMSISWGWWGSWLQLVWQAGGDLVSEDGLQAFPNSNALKVAT